MNISIHYLSNKVESALEGAVIQMQNNILESIWSEEGGGWQEHWTYEPRPYAGLYASCDGLSFLCSTCQLQDGALRQTIERVYHKHIKAQFAKLDPHASAKQRDIHDTNAVVVMKMAKFIEISAVIEDAPKDLVQDVVDRLLQSQLKPGVWPATTGGRTASVAATHEALVALASYSRNQHRGVIKQGLYFLHDVSQHHSSGKWSLVATHAILRIISMSHDEEISYWSLPQAQEYLHWPKKYLIVRQDDSSLYAEEKFPVYSTQRTGIGEYYNFNLRLLSGLCLLNLLIAERIPLFNVRYTLATIADVAEQVIQEGYYHSSGRPHPLFWEHCCAVQMLQRFRVLLENKPELKSEEYMLIKPEYFNRKDFDIKDEVVVLMPFGPAWSMDVFEVLREVAQTHKMSTWRSDIDFGRERIIQKIWDRINEAQYIVADCTGKNPNVFYELGIAHTLGKKTFICAQKRKDIPFDIGAIPSFEYKSVNPSSLKKLASALDNFIRSNP